MSVLLTLNRFHPLFWCFHCWLSPRNVRKERNLTTIVDSVLFIMLFGWCSHWRGAKTTLVTETENLHIFAIKEIHSWLHFNGKFHLKIIFFGCYCKMDRTELFPSLSLVPPTFWAFLTSNLLIEIKTRVMVDLLCKLFSLISKRK